MQHEYFAASNSAQGFKNYYSEVFARADFIYIIKGGPGTGKSSFMKKHARMAESEGKIVEYYYCSSDPTSLDGVLIFGEDRIVGILDGTAPHVKEPKFPGACEEIVNLGQCWDGELLKRKKNEIVSLSERKSGEYKRAYTFLRSVGPLRAVSDGLIEPLLDREKIRGVISRMIKELPSGKLSYLPALVDSVSMNGRVVLDTFEKNTERLYIITDFYGVGEIFLDELFILLQSKGVRARVSFDPVCPEHIDGIFLENEGTAFLTSHILTEEYQADMEHNMSDKMTVINSKRFIDMDGLRDVRSELRYTARIARESFDGALHALKKAKIYHFLLEDIYGKAMDWKKFNEIVI